MFSLFFTTPRKRRHRKVAAQQEETPSRYQTVFTWVLVAVWVVLMSLGVATILQPKWLQDLGSAGRRVESGTLANFGDRLLGEGKYLHAIAQYQRSLEIQPDQVRVQAHLAIAWINAGEVQKGEQMLRDALEKAPSKPLQGIICYNLGMGCERRGQTEEAISYFRQAQRLYAEQDRVCRKLGSSYLELAKRRVKESRNLVGQELEEARRLAGRDLEQARLAFEEALASQLDLRLSYKKMLHQALDSFTEQPEHLAIIEEQLTRGISVEDLARYDLQIIRQLQQSDSEVAKTHNHLGSIYGQLSRFTKVREHFEESLRIWPGNADATRNLQLLEQLQPPG